MERLPPALHWRQLGLYAPVFLLPQIVLAHTMEDPDANFVQGVDGPAVGPFIYLGAKHMVTGYDHILFLAGVVFFLYRPRHVVLYVSLFALGHSISLLLGVLADLRVSVALIDMIIGLSIVYKAFENMDGFRRLSGFQPDMRIAVFIFGLFHGLGLAGRLQDLSLSNNGLVTNLISFNIGVEVGQILVLSMILIALSCWRANSSYLRYALVTNTTLMTAGFLLAGYQFSAFLLQPPY